MSQGLLTDEEDGFSNKEKTDLFKLGFEDGDLEYLDSKDIVFNAIKNAYMHVLSEFGINEVTYEQLINDDNYFIPNNPDLTRHVVAKRTIDNLLSGGRRRRTRRKRRTRTRRKRRTRTRRRR